PTCRTRLPDLPDLPDPPTYPKTYPHAARQGRATASERESQSDLTDALFRLLKIAGVGQRSHEIGVRRLVGKGPREPATVESRRARRARASRVQRVEQVEHFADCLDARRAGDAESLRHAEVELRERRPAAAVNRRAGSEAFH